MGVKGGCILIMKILLFVFNFIVWFAGAAIFGFALYYRFQSELTPHVEVDDDRPDKENDGQEALTEYYMGLYLLLGIGGVIMIIGFLGCCGAIKESVCQLTIYFIVVFIIIGAEIACGIWIFINKDKVNDTLSEFSANYDTDFGFRTTMDFFQETFSCCGVEGPDDWVKLNISIPKSCGNATCTEEACKDKEIKIHQLGCTAVIRQSLLTMSGIIAGIICAQIIAVISSIVLCRAIRDIDDDWDDDDKSFS